MKKLTEQRANELRAEGYTHIASVVKSYNATTYWHVNSIDEIMANGGKWIPAAKGQWGNWHGRIGITTAQMNARFPHACGTCKI